jgi:hypothetical protein
MIDLACYSYIARCSAIYSALRCLLVVVELLRLRGGGAVDEAAKWAMRARDEAAKWAMRAQDEAAKWAMQAQDEAAKWAMRARDVNTLGRIGHALVTARVGDCYAVREGTGSRALGSRRRKAAMWKMLAANEWLAAGKPAQARHCLDFALPIYEQSKFGVVVAFVEDLKRRAGYTPLVDIDGEKTASGGEEPEVESEALELGSNRKSVIGPLSGDIEENKDDSFVES